MLSPSSKTKASNKSLERIGEQVLVMIPSSGFSILVDLPSLAFFSPRASSNVRQAKYKVWTTLPFTATFLG